MNTYSPELSRERVVEEGYHFRPLVLVLSIYSIARLDFFVHIYRLGLLVIYWLARFLINLAISQCDVAIRV